VGTCLIIEKIVVMNLMTRWKIPDLQIPYVPEITSAGMAFPQVLHLPCP
jgi:hypothetical protein